MIFRKKYSRFLGSVVVQGDIYHKKIGDTRYVPASEYLVIFFVLYLPVFTCKIDTTYKIAKEMFNNIIEPPNQ